MLSNKLTFSLASLIVLLMIGLAMPVDAQKIQGITVVTLPLIVDAGSVGEPQTLMLTLRLYFRSHQTLSILKSFCGLAGRLN